MFLFYPPYAPLVNLGHLFVLATTSQKEAGRVIGFSQSEYDGQVARTTKRFWSTVELLSGPDCDPAYDKMLVNALIVQDYVEALVFEMSKRSAMTYKADRKRFYEHRASLRDLETQIKICKLDPKLIREHVKASLRKN